MRGGTTHTALVDGGAVIVGETEQICDLDSHGAARRRSGGVCCVAAAAPRTFDLVDEMSDETRAETRLVYLIRQFQSHV